MTLSIASNIFSLSAQRSLFQTNQQLGTSFERLSSGLRINSAADDPAGLAVADSLRADARLATVAIRNANDGLSATSIADSALGEISDLLTRLAELAEQSSNGTYSTSQRSALASEFIALGSEVARITATTEFNDVQLIASNTSSITLQVGLDSSSNSQISVDGVDASLIGLGLATSEQQVSAGGDAALGYSIQSTSEADSISASLLALDAINSAISQLSSVRGTVGAAQSRLEVAVNNLTVARENFVAAESAIRDADVAQEVANLTRLQVVQQSAVAVLAQANQQPGVVLSLLQ